MKINIAIILIIIIGGIAITLFFDQKTTRTTHYQSLPNIEFNLLDNKTVFLHDFNESAIIVHFWATWCAPCLVEIPSLFEMAQENEENIQIIAVAVQDSPKKIQSFFEKTTFKIPKNVHIALDPDWQIAKLIFNTTRLPESFLISPNQEIIDRHNGAVKNWVKMPWVRDFNRLQVNNYVDKK